MSKFEETAKKIDPAVGDIENLKLEMEAIVGQNKDNKELQRYVELMQQVEVINRSVDTYKKDIYFYMLEENREAFTGSHCTISLKKPYTKTAMDLATFLKDCDITKDPRLLKVKEKYVQDQTVKGNTILKLLTENK